MSRVAEIGSRRKLDFLRYPGRGVFLMKHPIKDVPILKLDSLDLMHRRHFVDIFGKSLIDRLVNENLLTPYHPNGQAKKRRKGKYPNGSTWYDWREFMNIDFNNPNRNE